MRETKKSCPRSIQCFLVLAVMSTFVGLMMYSRLHPQIPQLKIRYFHKYADWAPTCVSASSRNASLVHYQCEEIEFMSQVLPKGALCLSHFPSICEPQYQQWSQIFIVLSIHDDVIYPTDSGTLCRGLPPYNATICVSKFMEDLILVHMVPMYYHSHEWHRDVPWPISWPIIGVCLGATFFCWICCLRLLFLDCLGGRNKNHSEDLDEQCTYTELANLPKAIAVPIELESSNKAIPVPIELEISNLNITNSNHIMRTTTNIDAENHDECEEPGSSCNNNNMSVATNDEQPGSLVTNC